MLQIELNFHQMLNLLSEILRFSGLKRKSFVLLNIFFYRKQIPTLPRIEFSFSHSVPVRKYIIRNQDLKVSVMVNVTYNLTMSSSDGSLKRDIVTVTLNVSLAVTISII